MSKNVIQSMRRSVRLRSSLYATQLNSNSALHRMSVSALRITKDKAILVLSSNVQLCLSKSVQRNMIGSTRQPINKQCSTSYHQLALLAVEKTRMAGLGEVDLLVHVDRNILLATWTEPSDRPRSQESSRTLWSQSPCCPTTVFQATFVIHHFTNPF